MTKEEDRIETFEDILAIVGTNGKINFLIFFCAAIGGLITPLHTFSYEFLGATPNHWCHVDELTNASWTTEQIKNISIPSTYKNGMKVYESCRMYDMDYESLSQMQYEDAFMLAQITHHAGGNNTKWCYRRDFEGDLETIVTKWDLVCERRALYSTTQAAVQGGMLIGSLASGYLMDRLGRMRIYKYSVTLYCLCGLISAFSPTIGFFIATKVLSAMLGFSFYLAGFVFSMEMCSTKQRSSVGSYYVIPWAFGMMLCAGISYYVRPWYYLQIAFTVPAFLLFFNFKILPESPRWLILNGRHDDAFNVLKRIAKSNKRTLHNTESLFAAMENIERVSKDNIGPAIENKSFFERISAVVKRILALLLNAHLRIRSVCIFVCFFSVSMVYYGVSLGSTNLSTDPYIYLLIGGALELPSYLLLWPTVSLFGRRKSLILFYSLSAISILSAMSFFITGQDGNDDYHILKLVLFLLGKFSITPAFHLSWVYAAELFPTTLRSLALGEANCIARVGSICSPYINDLLSVVSAWSPAAVFGSFSLIAGLLTLPLPETTVQVLPESIQRKKPAFDSKVQIVAKEFSSISAAQEECVDL